MADSVKGGTEVEQHQSTHITSSIALIISSWKAMMARSQLNDVPCRQTDGTVRAAGSRSEL